MPNTQNFEVNRSRPYRVDELKCLKFKGQETIITSKLEQLEAYKDHQTIHSAERYTDSVSELDQGRQHQPFPILPQKYHS